MPYYSKAAAAIAFATTALAQGGVTPFAVTGSLDSCNPATGTANNRGGSIRVNNFDITVPENLIVQFPTVWAPFAELCGAGADNFETTVVGNIVNNNIIAGQISVAQRFGLEGSQGYIDSISNGKIKIANGPTVVINDPEGLFGPPTDDSHKYWVADTENPSITSFSGYPMCIPHSGNTASCKASNRGTGQSFTPRDQTSMVPFKAGDFIEYSGLIVGGEIWASAIVAISLDITTNGPQHIRVEEFLVGVPDNAANVEVADIRAVGFLSKCAGATVFIDAIEVDPCTGKETYRRIGSTSPRQETRCKWELRTASPAQAPFTREYRVTTNTATQTTTWNTQAGSYVQAVAEWIFPEVDVPGTNPPPYRFSQIKGIAQGDFLDGKQYGQLKPYPEASAPTLSKECSPADIPDPNATPTPSATPDSSAQQQAAPVVSIAGVSSIQRSGVSVELSGSNSEKSLTDNDLVYSWKQSSPASPTATINNKDTSKCNFIAPKPSGKTDYVFELTISLKSNSTNFNKATTKVTIDPTIADTVSQDSYTWESKQSGTLTAACSSNVQTSENTAMTLVINNGATSFPMTALSGQPGKWTINRRSTARPTNVKCVSNLKGESPVRSGATNFRRSLQFW
ncbi:hypothetical protein ACN47E_001975 [Coniothyrium glycines]